MLSEGSDERHTFATWNSPATLLQFRWTESMQTQIFFLVRKIFEVIFLFRRCSTMAALASQLAMSLPMHLMTMVEGFFINKA